MQLYLRYIILSLLQVIQCSLLSFSRTNARILAIAIENCVQSISVDLNILYMIVLSISMLVLFFMKIMHLSHTNEVSDQISEGLLLKHLQCCDVHVSGFPALWGRVADVPVQYVAACM